jgi:hypothetical protein
MASTPEGKVKRDIKAYLDSIGAYWFMVMSNGMGRVGCPDFLVCHNGKFIGIETKAPGKRGNTTPNQDRELAAIRAANGVAVVVDDVTQLQEILK